MVVCLPYGGGIEGSPAAKLLLIETNRKKYPCVSFCSLLSERVGWGGIPNYPTMDTLVFESIEALESEFKEIDVNRIYVTGVSRGGYGSWHFISLRPDLFAAAMPVCGGGDPNLTPNIIDVDVWAFHGENDIGVPVSGSRDMIAAIKKSGGNPKYTEFEGAGTISGVTLQKHPEYSIGCLSRSVSKCHAAARGLLRKTKKQLRTVTA